MLSLLFKFSVVLWHKVTTHTFTRVVNVTQDVSTNLRLYSSIVLLPAVVCFELDKTQYAPIITSVSWLDGASAATVGPCSREQWFKASQQFESCTV